MNQLKQFLLQLLERLTRKEPAVENNTTIIYTEEQLMARLKFFIGICLSLTLFGIVFVVLYSLIFVTQPLNAISPIDQKFFELIIPIATFLTGTLSGIMLASPGDKEAQKEALKAANSGWDRGPKSSSTTISGPFGAQTISSTNSGGFGSGPAFGATPTSSFGNNVSTGFGAPTGFNQQFAMTASGKRIIPEEPFPEL
jgi:hypothetical protein